MKLSSPTSVIPGIGEKVAIKLKRLDINTVSDLIYFFPRSWTDLTHPMPVSFYRVGQDVVIKAKISSISLIKTPRKRMYILQAKLIDSNNDTIYAIWFNQPFLKNTLREGETWIFWGKMHYDFSVKKKALVSPDYTKKPQILPVYWQTEGLSTKSITKFVRLGLNHIKVDEYLPDKFLSRYKLIDIKQAIENIHDPKDMGLLQSSKKRLSIDELLFIYLKLLSRKKALKDRKPVPIEIEGKYINFIRNLPFKLTQAQNKVLQDVLDDLASSYPMTRLINGDVGSGKTIIAVIVSYIISLNKLQTVFIAPTQILAKQHYDNFKKYFSSYNISISLVTSDTKKDANFKADILIGTHALLQKDVDFKRLGLIIVDEEHRFGVKQREFLLKKNKEIIPHFLSLTATPIPRTLAFAIYGDLDISVVDQMPEGRKEIVTRLVESQNRTKAYDFIKKLIDKGQQAFVVCPLIEENNDLPVDNLFDLDRKSVKKEFDRLSKDIFKNYNIAMIHGKMKSEEKNKIMTQFAEGKTQILVSTSLIEVGVDVPNATVMLIEDAEKFGLAQLHQFRGRVGRGDKQSYCLLFSNSVSPKSKKRLSAMETIKDGFKLAQMDLKSRGPGSITGTQQSGFLDLKIANLTDTISLSTAKDIANEIIEDGLDNYPEIIKAMNNEGRIYN